MKLIPETFSKSGWQFRQIERKGNLAIFERSKDEGKPHYEVVKIRAHNGFKIPGTETMAEPAEVYPSDTAWGRDGFTYSTLDEARQKLESWSSEPTVSRR